MKTEFGPNVNKLMYQVLIDLIAQEFVDSHDLFQNEIGKHKFNMTKLIEESERNTRTILMQLITMPGNPYGKDVEAIAGAIIKALERLEK